MASDAQNHTSSDVLSDFALTVGSEIGSNADFVRDRRWLVDSCLATLEIDLSIMLLRVFFSGRC